MKKLNKLGYTKVEVLIIIILLGVATFITINSTSYAFAMNDDSVNDTKRLIEHQAEEYALDNLDLFKESDTNYILVSDLVEKNYMMANEDGKVTNPNNIKENFNDNKIKLEYDKENNKAKAIFID